jgi:uncharacterized protein (DUF433 family)
VSRKIPAREIVNDLRAGMRKRQLMQKYALSADALQRIVEQILGERKARAEAIARDVRAGLSDVRLMERYQLSRDGLRLAFEALVAEGLIDLRELGARNSLERDSVIINFRQGVRRHPVEKVVVCDKSRPERQYVLRDISEDGLSVFGMDAQVNQTVTMALLGDDDGELVPFEFDAECRWTAPSFSGKPEIAGFRITNISEEALGQLIAIVQRYS